MSDDPLNLTLRQVFAVVEQGNTEFDKAWGNDPLNQRNQVIDAFGELHPAHAGDLLLLLVEGLDQGYTAQGGYHPDFQRIVSHITRDPEDRFK